MSLSLLLLCIVAALAGAVVAALLLRLQSSSTEAIRGIELVQLRERLQDLRETETRADALLREREDLRVALGRAETAAAAQREAAARLERELAEAKVQGGELATLHMETRAHLGELTSALDHERKSNAEKVALLTEAREGFTDQFRALANDILEEKAKRFTEQNQVNLGQLLDPLKSRLLEFQGRVEQVYDLEGQQRSALAAQVKQLMELNRKLSDDAAGLTQALKGSSKAQGDWGEVVLESILEAAGLRRDHEFYVQQSVARDQEGSRARPDVVLRLPEGKHLIIDAKVSLLDYTEHVNCTEDTARNEALARHLLSVRSHIKRLSEQNYQLLDSLPTMDFVLMFVPIEPAFLSAVNSDANLWTHAWERNVLLVSPSTLLFVLRTVRHLWRQEEQANNVREIAQKGGELYDKFVAFAADLTKVGERLGQARESYDAAFNKLKEGRGNLVARAESLRRLGVKSSKALPRELVLGAEDTAFSHEPSVLQDEEESTRS